MKINPQVKMPVKDMLIVFLLSNALLLLGKNSFIPDMYVLASVLGMEIAIACVYVWVMGVAPYVLYKGGVLSTKNEYLFTKNVDVKTINKISIAFGVAGLEKTIFLHTISGKVFIKISYYDKKDVRQLIERLKSDNQSINITKELEDYLK